MRSTCRQVWRFFNVVPIYSLRNILWLTLHTYTRTRSFGFQLCHSPLHSLSFWGVLLLHHPRFISQCCIVWEWYVCCECMCCSYTWYMTSWKLIALAYTQTRTLSFRTLCAMFHLITIYSHKYYFAMNTHTHAYTHENSSGLLHVTFYTQTKQCKSKQFENGFRGCFN